jgi:TctA family transporter
VPTVAFGVPGSAGTAVLLGAFMVHGLIPGPQMLDKNLSVTYAMVWSVALANIVGAGLCYLFSAQFARVATLRYTLILPSVLGIVYIGAFEAGRDWGDLFALLFFGVLGWIMKQLKWPRPPLILGFVLGDIFERYLFVSVERYGADWLARPFVVVLFVLAFAGLARPLWQDVKLRKLSFGAPRLQAAQLLPLTLVAVFVYMLLETRAWPSAARIVPQIVGTLGLAFAAFSLANAALRRGASPVGTHMDLASDTGNLPIRTVLARAAAFFGWFVAFMACTALIGLLPTVPIFVVAYMRLENREPWRLVLAQAGGFTLFIYVVFHRLLTVAWPETLAGTWFPALKIIPSL